VFSPLECSEFLLNSPSKVVRSGDCSFCLGTRTDNRSRHETTIQTVGRFDKPLQSRRSDARDFRDRRIFCSLNSKGMTENALVAEIASDEARQGMEFAFSQSSRIALTMSVVNDDPHSVCRQRQVASSMTIINRTAIWRKQPNSGGDI